MAMSSATGGGGGASASGGGSYDYNGALNRVNGALGWNLSDNDVNEAFTKFGGNKNDTFTDAGLTPVYDYFKARGQNPGQPPPAAPPGAPAAPSGPPPPNNNYQSPSSSSNPLFQGVNSDLYQQLLTRAHQGTNVDPNDPNIKQQVEPFMAQQERSRRNYLSGAAEQEGNYGNLASESRASAEKVGQAGGELHASLVGKELQSKRDEIQQALTGLGGQLTADQSLGLQKELGYLNNSLGKYGIDSNANLGKYGIDMQSGTSRYGIDTNAGLTQQQINSNNDQFNANFGLNSTNQASYWDAVRRGLL